VITMPTRREQLADAPDDLRNLLRIVADRIAGAAEADRLARQAEEWVLTRLGADYPWPGNMRELEQCVRNIVFRGAYWPAQPAAAGRAAQPMPTADELLQHYCASVQAQTRNYHETGRLLHLDPRTVRTKVSAWSRRQRGGRHE
jgi:DNA-binding NtrC family response regulator